MDLSGKKTLITGASSGLGLATPRKFAEFGAHVIMVCRNEDKARIAAKSIKQNFTDAKLSLIICDLSSFSSTNNFINSVRKKYDRLDVLINNAAIMKQKRTLTKDGFETMFQVNFLSSVLLMNRLAPLLAKSSCGQIINITLPSSKLQLDFNNMQSEKRFESLDAFFKTKLALLLYSLSVAGNPAFERIKVTCAVPNTKPFRSDLVREAPFFAKVFKNLISIPVEKVVENMAYIVEQGIKDRRRGEIFEGKTIINPTSYWQNEKIREQVYELANNYIAQFSS